MRSRSMFLASVASLTMGAAWLAACSSDDTNNPPTDTDSGTADTGGGSETGAKDAGPDTAKQPLPVCTKNGIGGACDLVSQNCPNPNDECAVVNGDAGKQVTVCQPKGTGSILEGDKCTPSGNNNPCVAGLTCIGSTGTARCSKYCCDRDSTQCGSSPEGFIGVCDLNVLDQKTQNQQFMVCEYSPPCQPFGVQPCTAPNQTCLVKDPVGTSACSDIYQPPGKDEGQACNSANACKDGMMCIGNPGACTYVCYAKTASAPPFDAGALDLKTAGKGGCPPNKVCGSGTITGLPSWLHICQ